MSTYSTNRIKNGSAENDLTNWITQNALAILGGTEGNKCFQLGAAGFIKQSYNAPKQASGILVEGAFLPQYYNNYGNVKTNINVVIRYGDGTVDKQIIVCKGSDSYGY